MGGFHALLSGKPLESLRADIGMPGASAPDMTKAPVVSVVLGLFVTACSQGPTAPEHRTSTNTSSLVACKVLPPGDNTWTEGVGEECVDEEADAELEKQLAMVDWNATAFDEDPEPTADHWYAMPTPVPDDGEDASNTCSVEDVCSVDSGATGAGGDSVIALAESQFTLALPTMYIAAPLPVVAPAPAPVVGPPVPWNGTPQVNTQIPYKDFGPGTHIKIVTVEVVNAQGQVVATHQGWGVSGPSATNNVKPTFANGAPIAQAVPAAGGHGDIRGAIIEKIEVPKGCSTVTRAGGFTVGASGPDWVYRSDLNMRDMAGGDRALTPAQQKIFRGQVDSTVQVPKNADQCSVPKSTASCKANAGASRYPGGRTSLVSSMKAVSAQTLQANAQRWSVQGGFSIMAANAIMAAGQVVSRYHTAHVEELVEKNKAAFNEEFAAWLSRQAKASGEPMPDDDKIRNIGRQVLVHFYDADTLTAALKERESTCAAPGKSLTIEMMERAAGNRYLELRFLEETGWKPRWSYVQRTRTRWYSTFILAFDDLLYTSPTGKKTVVVKREGNFFVDGKPSLTTSWDEYVRWNKATDYSVAENHTFDTPAPTVPDLGMRVFHLPKVPLTRSSEVAAAIQKAEDLAKPAARVREAYEKSLGRTPTCEEVDAQLASGLPVDQLRANIANSAEAAAKLHSLYAEVLLRKPTPEELASGHVLLGKGVKLDDIGERLRRLPEYGNIAMLRHYLGNDTKAIEGYLTRIRNGESADAIREEIFKP